MKVVQVSARRDYEGTQWTKLFSSVEAALFWVGNVDAEEFLGVDAVTVDWVGVDSDFYESVDQFECAYDFATDTVQFTRWDTETKTMVSVEV